MQSKVTVLAIDWSESGGHYGSAGSPYAFGWLRALYAPKLAIRDSHVVAVARDPQSRGWAEHRGAVTQPDAEALARAVAELGLPGKAPRVESIPDTGDGWSACHVRVAVGEEVGTFSVHAESSGFRGPDADALRRLFQRLYALAGCRREVTMFRDADPGRPGGVALYSERLLGLRGECSLCSGLERSTGWLLRREGDDSRWYVDLKCTSCGSRGGTWRREWAALIGEAIDAEGGA